MNNITTIQTSVYAIIAEQLGIDWSRLTLEMRLADLGTDSLDQIQAIMALEERFGVQINDAEFEEIETVQQVIDLVVRLRS